MALKYSHILAATDFSELGDVALARAAELARQAGARLTALHVLPEPNAPSPLYPHYEVHTDDDRVARARAEAEAALADRIPESVRDAGIPIDYVVRLGDPASEILSVDVQLRPDLIVVATHGRRGWQHFIMGSVAERVVQMAHADVLTVRERGTRAGSAPPIR